MSCQNEKTPDYFLIKSSYKMKIKQNLKILSYVFRCYFIVFQEILINLYFVFCILYFIFYSIL